MYQLSEALLLLTLYPRKAKIENRRITCFHPCGSIEVVHSHSSNKTPSKILQHGELPGSYWTPCFTNYTRYTRTY